MVSRGLKPERIDVWREVQVVVDRLGHVHDPETTRGSLDESMRRVRSVVAADRDELGDSKPQQRDDRVLEVLLDHRRIRPRDSDMRTATEVNPTNFLDGERDHVVDIAAHDPFEAIPNPDDLDVLQLSAYRRRTNHAIDAGGRATGDKNRKPFVMHG